MWRRLYFLLLFLRIYFATCPSYIHPDEHFQGPEVIAGQVFGFPSHLTWEFTAQHPIRSFAPLWLVYGLPLKLLRVLWAGLHHGESPSTAVIYYALRMLMFCLTFVLEDWAIYELVPLPRYRKTAAMLVTSSFVTAVHQSHTFSNSLETILVLWAHVVIQRIWASARQASLYSAGILGFICAMGLWNRITFPAYVLLPCLSLIPHLLKNPVSVVSLGFTFGVTSLFAITLDTLIYRSGISSQPPTSHHLIFTPLNNILYNVNPSNLAKHGLHPLYQHLLVNVPMLFGPAILLIPGSIRIARRESTLSLWHITNALVPIFLLSLLPHQEARFLMPSVPLLLSSLHLPQSQRLRRIWIGFWIVFNLGLAIILGTYHQGGVVPMQLHLARQDLTTGSGAVVWWKCYSPPRWLLGERGHQFQTIDLQGAPELEVVQGLRSLACESKAQQLRLVAPLSANLLDKFNRNDQNEEVIKLIPEKFYYQHINPEDFDPRRHGFLGAAVQIWKQRGLGLWRVQVDCSSPLVY